jgi:hypothetical protein
MCDGPLVDPLGVMVDNVAEIEIDPSEDVI